VRLALIAMTGEMGYPSALTARTWGYYDVLFKGKPFGFQRGYGSYVMENVLFKISYPAEFHSQTAVEAAMTLHVEVKDRIDDIEKIVIETQEAAVRIIDKTGPLDNPADRDHCIQYMVAVPLIFGRLTAADYEDDVANDPRIDVLRDTMEVREHEQYTKDYFDPEKRYIGNALQVFFKDGTSTDRIGVDFPIGHRERRKEGIPVLKQKFVDSVSPKLKAKQWAELDALCADREKLAATAVDNFMALLVA
jgi:2-methylcitrate dehydratase